MKLLGTRLRNIGEVPIPIKDPSTIYKELEFQSDWDQILIKLTLNFDQAEPMVP